MRLYDLSPENVKIGLRIRAWSGHTGTITHMEIINNIPHTITTWDDGIMGYIKPYTYSAVEVIGNVDYFIVSARKKMILCDLPEKDVVIGIKVKCGNLIGTVVNISYLYNKMYISMHWNDEPIDAVYRLPHSFYLNEIIYYPCDNCFIVSGKNNANL